MKAILKKRWGQFEVGDTVELNEVQMEFALRKDFATKVEEPIQKDKVDPAVKGRKKKGNGM